MNKISKIRKESNLFTKELNNGKNIFVFGSNYGGRHGAGAAYTAKCFWGARQFESLGRTGQAYAIPTKDRELKTLPLNKIKGFVDDFIDYATLHPELTFLVTKIGCGLAGYQESEIAPMFKNSPSNCVLPVGWTIFF